MTPPPIRLRGLRLALGVLWCVLVGLGFWRLFAYESRPGAGAVLASWPAGAGIELDRERPTLLVFVHPQCPCSRATIAELDRLVTHVRDRARIEVLVYDDPALGSDWARGPLVSSAERIPGVQVASDVHGVMARRFASTTSGQTLLFAPDGRLLFSGGITDGRGCEGDNPGSAAVLALLDDPGDPARGPIQTPVYGCSLVDPERAPPAVENGT